MKQKFLPLFIALLVAISVEAQELCAKNPCAKKSSVKESCEKKEPCLVEMNHFYATFYSGANFLQDTNLSGNKTSYRTGYIVSGSLGYCWRYGLHFETEYAFRKNGVRKIQFFTEGVGKEGSCFTSSYMANLLWYLPLSSWGYTCWNIQPLVGIGLGYDFQQMHASNSRINFYERWRNVSWQLMAGLAYPVYRNTELFLEYKFHEGGTDFFNHAIGFGLTYKFGYLK